MDQTRALLRSDRQQRSGPGGGLGRWDHRDRHHAAGAGDPCAGTHGGQDLNERLSEALRELGPFFVGFLLSFVATAIAWAAHRPLRAHLEDGPHPGVAEHPVSLSTQSAAFGAALISQYEREPVALRVYGLQLLLIALTRLIVWLYATNRQHLLYEPIGRRTKTVGVLLVAVPAALYVLAILIAGSAPVASLVIYVGALVLYFIAILVDRVTAPPGAVEDDFT